MLNFTFPGHPDIELIEKGTDMPVTTSNLDQYLQLLTQFFFDDNVRNAVV